MLLASDEDYMKIKTIVIDPGHGGEDPGALGKIAKEKDIVLAVALKLGQIINQNNSNIKIIYTRNTDVFIPLYERADIANKNHADLFISIHANANHNSEVYGAETYAMGLYTSEKNLEVAKKENAVITLEKDYTTKYEGYDPNSAESFIIFSLMQNTFLEQSLEFASYVQEQFVKSAQRTDRGVKQAGFLVLWKTTMPSVLIETGYISNPKEEKYLISKTGQEELANSIYKAFINYKNTIESRNTATKPFDSKSADHSDTVKNNDSICFKIQITSSKNQLNLDNIFFKPCHNIKGNPHVEEYYSNNTYKYTIGNMSSYQEIIEFNKEVRQYFPDSFIVAIKNGKIIPIGDAIKQTNN
jgi:N-acetylmuramoyl-L-alanine amidase